MLKINQSLLSFLLLLALAGMAVLSVYLTLPPQAQPADAPQDEFSATRAMAYVREVAKEPHAMGTPAHARVRAYLLQEMQKLGLNPQVQETTAVLEAGQVCYAGYVYNVLGRLKGNRPGKAVLLVAHYDSQPNTPGAGDDATGVAALLETARALRQGEQLQNDIIFLLTDGEEYGLLGARGFMQHPWAQEAGVVINVEARGNSGASASFEMSSENGWVVQEFAKAAPYPMAGSIMYEVYKKMPNSTDFTVFSDAGITGVNSAFVEGFVNYHSMTDTPENLNQNSLQHHGSNMLALAKHFGSIPLDNTKAPDRVFFNPVGKWLVQYPVGLNMLWGGIVTLLLVVVWAVGTKRKAFTGMRALAGALVYVLVLGVVAGLFLPINNLVTGAMPYFTESGTYNIYLFLGAYLLLGMGLFLLLYRLAQVWLKPLALAMGACLIWFVAFAVVMMSVPSAAYLFLFPLMFCLAGLLFVTKGRSFKTPGSVAYPLGLLVAALPALFMWTPVVQLLMIIFDLNMPVAMVSALAVLMGLLLPLLLYIEGGFRVRDLPVLPALLILAGAVLTMAAINAEKPGPGQPFKTQLSYYLNADTGEALWASGNSRHDNWTGSFFTKNSTKTALTSLYPHASLQYHITSAPQLPLQAPEAEVVQDSTAGNSRVVQVQLRSVRGAQHLELVLQPENAEDIKAIRLNGQLCTMQPLDTAEGAIYMLRLYGLPLSKEAILEVEATPGSKVGLLLYDQSIGLPQQLLPSPMPADVVPAQGRFSNLVVVRKKYEF
ncbi:M28 family peptidase [Pontibacter sp. SGAir0037]|uniref:M28 family peptidase n=1 Tax=Pontibacter sp. SGAir0037 TaxID=2571030 RepID=UPI0010CD33DE|nr:M28 family peptidase [Pontibacter sp. SGAir0037]QCR23712.1 metallopeptidase [Pontibacter sp. SGAir0037]